MDREWIKNLAQAQRIDGQLVPSDPEMTQSLRSQRLAESAHNLLALAQESAAFFNEYGGRARQINVVRLPEESLMLGDSQRAGFLVMFGKSQAKVLLLRDHLSIAISTQQFFQQTPIDNWNFAPTVDPFGDMLWTMTNHDKQSPPFQQLNNEMIVKHIFFKLVSIET